MVTELPVAMPAHERTETLRSITGAYRHQCVCSVYRQTKPKIIQERQPTCPVFTQTGGFTEDRSSASRLPVRTILATSLLRVAFDKDLGRGLSFDNSQVGFGFGLKTQHVYYHFARLSFSAARNCKLCSQWGKRSTAVRGAYCLSIEKRVLTLWVVLCVSSSWRIV